MTPASAKVDRRPVGVARFRSYLESYWLGKRFTKAFWTFFIAALLYDFGFGLYFFLFNLFLANLHYKEDVLGFVTGALTIGNVVGSIPVSMLARRFGLQRTLLLGFLASPVICILRTLILWMPAQMGLAFLAGFALSSWTVCFSPAVANLTNEENRVSGFSIVFATGIGAGTLAGFVGGYLPALLKATQSASQLPANIRLVLLLACGVTMLGILPLLKTRFDPVSRMEEQSAKVVHPFLFRFLPPFFLWSIVTGAFTPFAAVYLQQHLRISLPKVGIMFSMAQLAQLTGALAAPFFFRRLGTVLGIFCMQFSTAIAMLAFGLTQDIPASLILYLSVTGLQFMSGPGIYSLLMTRLPEHDRSPSSALQNMTGALSHAGVAIVAGVVIVRYGYSTLLTGNAGVALAAALLLLLLLGSKSRHAATTPQAVETS